MTRKPTDGGANHLGKRLDRRSMLMALGAGSSVALTSPAGAASVQGDGDDEGGGGNGNGSGGGDGRGNRRCPPCIDRYSGYLVVGEESGDRPLGSIDPVTTVELRVSDADVVFAEEAGPATETTGPGTTVNGTATARNETGSTANETVTELTPTATPANQTAAANGTGNETEVGSAETATETGIQGEPGAIPDFYFDPVGVHVQPGESIEFAPREQLHTVTAFHPRYGFQLRVPEAAPGFSSPPLLEGDSWYYRFDEPGVYDLLCLPHYGLGMVMRVVVVDADSQEVPEAPPLPGQDRPEIALPEIEQKILTASELEPQNIVDEGPIPWDALSGVESEPPTGF